MLICIVQTKKRIFYNYRPLAFPAGRLALIWGRTEGSLSPKATSRTFLYAPALIFPATYAAVFSSRTAREMVDLRADSTDVGAMDGAEEPEEPLLLRRPVSASKGFHRSSVE